MATKTIPQILRDNICTVFNLLNLTIAIALAAVGAWKNILFLLVILINTVMGIVQEIKAKRQIQRLTLLAQPVVTVLRDGAEERIRLEDFQTGDVLAFTGGSAVCTATPGFLCLSITIPHETVSFRSYTGRSATPHSDVRRWCHRTDV